MEIALKDKDREGVRMAAVIGRKSTLEALPVVRRVPHRRMYCNVDSSSGAYTVKCLPSILLGHRSAGILPLR